MCALVIYLGKTAQGDENWTRTDPESSARSNSGCVQVHNGVVLVHYGHMFKLLRGSVTGPLPACKNTAFCSPAASILGNIFRNILPETIFQSMSRATAKRFMPCGKCLTRGRCQPPREVWENPLIPPQMAKQHPPLVINMKFAKDLSCRATFLGSSVKLQIPISRFQIK